MCSDETINKLSDDDLSKYTEGSLFFFRRVD